MMKDPNFDIRSILQSELESVQASDTQKELIYWLTVIQHRHMHGYTIIAWCNGSSKSE